MKRALFIYQKRGFAATVIPGGTIPGSMGGLPHQPSSGNLSPQKKKINVHYRFKGADAIYKPLIITGPPCSGKVSNDSVNEILI